LAPKTILGKTYCYRTQKAIKSLTSITPDELVYISEVYKVAKQIVIDLEWEKYGYTILVNGGTRQEVGQIHFHLQSEDKQVTSATNPEGYKTSHNDIRSRALNHF
jgi:diadenosine tetraphosphate (Ap4A) HIT family hydrolase